MSVCYYGGPWLIGHTYEYGIHKNLYISPFIPTIFGPIIINYGPPPEEPHGDTPQYKTDCVRTVWKIVHDVPTRPPTVAGPLID